MIKIFLIQPFYIPSESMVPTLLVDDRVMVSKLNYRLGEVDRGDVVVFETGVEQQETIPEAIVRSVVEALGIRTSGVEDLIKRVIAVGGDVVEIRDNQVLVNGDAIKEPYISPDPAMDDMAPVTIPEGELWVMGDNRARNRSQDSRFFGPISEQDLVGQAVLLVWPIDRIGGL